MMRKIIAALLSVSAIASFADEPQKLYNPVLKVLSSDLVFGIPLDELESVSISPDAENPDTYILNWKHSDYEDIVSVDNQQWNSTYSPITKFSISGSKNWEIQSENSEFPTFYYDGPYSQEWFETTVKVIYHGDVDNLTPEEMQTKLYVDPQHYTAGNRFLNYVLHYTGFVEFYNEDSAQWEKDITVYANRINNIKLRINHSAMRPKGWVELNSIPLSIEGEEGCKFINFICRHIMYAYLLNPYKPTMVAANNPTATISYPIDWKRNTKFGFDAKIHTDSEEWANANIPADAVDITIPTKLSVEAGQKQSSINVQVNVNLDSPSISYFKTYNIPFTFYREDDNYIFDENATQDYIDDIKNTLLPGGTNKYTVLLPFFIESPNRIHVNPDKVLFTDCEPTEGSINELFDDDVNTFIHSKWSQMPDRSAPYGSYLEIEFDQPVQELAFTMRTRSNVGPAYPKTIHLYYSNDRENWVLFAKPKVEGEYSSDSEILEFVGDNNMFAAPEKFKYLRWCVIENSKGQPLINNDSNNYWHLSELRFYGK